ncbi:MAG: TlyA family RNA methyltransferase [Spirochaetia bacterium]|jgi:23S rRNA (cytidine1920-2'-O)/16S rRNA (cytidine1409-2'-O)-methyltransferase
MASRKIALIDLLKTLHPQSDERELRAQVLRGRVSVDGEKVVKPGTPVPPGAAVQVRPAPAFVSRGGEKLQAAIEAWRVECGGAAWIDAGCSTGGFTDCLLQHGASLVHAVDVGEGQLDWRLRGDPRVRTMERTNVMSLNRSDLVPLPARAVADLSFRSLQGAARHILDLTTEGWGIFLVKPQFELRRPPAGFRGVVRDAAAIREIVEDLVQRLSAEGVVVEKGIPSPLPGRKGNREFLFLLRRGTRGGSADLLSNLVLE